MKKKDEVEITPAMIDAGVSALVEHTPGFELDEERVRLIFGAMLKASSSARLARNW